MFGHHWSDTDLRSDTSSSLTCVIWGIPPESAIWKKSNMLEIISKILCAKMV